MAGVQVVGGMKGSPDFRPLDSQEMEGTFLYLLEIKSFPTFLHTRGNLWPHLMYRVISFY